MMLPSIITRSVSEGATLPLASRPCPIDRNPKRKRGSQIGSSLTLRVDVTRNRERSRPGLFEPCGGRERPAVWELRPYRIQILFLGFAARPEFGGQLPAALAGRLAESIPSLRAGPGT